jgi:hypothetical protein
LDGNDWFVTFRRQVGRIQHGEFRPLAGLRRPCAVMRGGCAMTPSGDIYFGEYIRRPDTAVHLYRLRRGETTLEVAHTFDPGEVRHVHGVYHDPVDGKLWCLTGDRDSECRIVVTDDGFRTLQVVGSGDESWRAVSLQFSQDAIYYATDAEFAPNALYRLDRGTGRRDKLRDLDGPVYFSHAHGEDRLFAVTAELCPSQVGRSASLWVLDGRENVDRVLSVEKDRWSPTYFLRGMIQFPEGPGRAEGVFFHTVALAGVDSRTFLLSRVDER